jgi:hypothetical protein
MNWSAEGAAPIQPPQPVQLRLWLVAGLFFGIGDVVLTGIGYGLPGVSEIGPVTALLLEQYGLGVMVALKAATFCGCYLLWKRVPQPHCVGIPLGLAMLGVSVTGWNLYVILFLAP